MGKRVGEVERLGEVWRYRVAWGGVEWHGEAWAWEQAAPHPHVVYKKQEGHLRSEGSQPQSRPPSSGLLH